MLIGELFWDFVYVAGIILAALSVVLSRSRLTKSKEPFSPRLWIRFSLILFGLCVLGLIEGSLLSPYGFGWFVLAMGVTVCVAARVLQRFMRLGRQ